MDDFKRLAAASYQDQTGHETPIETEVLDEGYQVGIEGHPFYVFYTVEHKTLTIEHDVKEHYIVCDTPQEVDTLIALLHRARAIMGGVA